MSNQEIVLASVGPVQGFIANARRCQDLWFGSWLLSELSRTIAKTLGAEGGHLIFPGDLRDDAAVANKILAVVPVGDGPTRARAAGQAMREHLKAIARDHFDRYEKRLGDDAKWFHRASAEAHVAELIELQWVVVPMRDGYEKAWRDAERLLAMRKASRVWPQIKGRAGVPKSSIDGSRESVIDEKVYEKKLFSPEQRRSHFLVKKSERLSGVDLLKRVGLELVVEDDERNERDWRRRIPKVFHSTSHVAAMPLLTRLERGGANADEMLRVYLRDLDALGLDLSRFQIRAGWSEPKARVMKPYGGEEICQPSRTLQQRNERGLPRGFDGVLLFESRLEDAFEQAPKRELDIQTAVKAAKDSLRRFLEKGLGYGGDSAPYAYYALLLADGDRMGAMLDELATTSDDALEEHRKVSGYLDSFASEARPLVEEHAGSVIYTGGDDVMALLPLHTALECAEALRALFEEKVAARVPPSVERPTLSVGLAIVHHLDRMREARELAKQAERAAKDGGRNALALAVKKRSGGTRIVCGRWDEEPENLARRIRRWAELLASGELPHAVGFELEQAARPFEIGEDAGRDEVRAVVSALAKRALGRRRKSEGDELDEAVSKLVEERVRASDPATSIGALADELHIARAFERAWRVAWGELATSGAEEAK